MLPTILQAFAVVYCTSLTVAQSLTTTPVTVRLNTGTFRGLRTPQNGTDQFLGIPYAQPPLGKLRFKAPKAITVPATGIQDASKFGNACPQPGTNAEGFPQDSSLGAAIAEDCLFLNVWRPVNTAANAKLPVLVWIHVCVYSSCNLESYS